MSTPTIKQEALDLMLAKIPESKHEFLKQTVHDLNLCVQELEKHPPTTMNYYGSYLPLCKDSITCYLLIIAGANEQGVKDAAKINDISL